jgi:membrane protease YdiL (CAAX protease family)
MAERCEQSQSAGERAGDAFPVLDLRGNFLFLAVYVVISLLFNIPGEEIYHRGFLLPMMHAVFGTVDWMASGVLYTLKHI